MAIDGIGKKAGGLPPTPPTSPAKGGTGAQDVDGARSKFEVGGAAQTHEAARAAQVGGVSSAQSADAVREGRLSLDAYLNQKVEDAARPFGNLPAGQLKMLKDALRAELASDPALVDWVKQATGAAPSLPEE
jgi:hypothetical protein